MKQVIVLNFLLMCFYTYGYVVNEPYEAKCNAFEEGQSFCVFRAIISSLPTIIIGSSEQTMRSDEGIALLLEEIKHGKAQSSEDSILARVANYFDVSSDKVIKAIDELESKRQEINFDTISNKLR